ncbi:hypothetical protein [Microbacterium sp. USHLN186]|uniref:hypothetical protein n=1 Tax=Microbacterium sp. USHLN186 TaxID=3081286 RepID=UPI0030193517
MKLRVGAAVALIFASVGLLSGCAPGGGKPSASPPVSASADAGEPSSSPTASAHPTPSPTPTTKPLPLPTDCRAILSPDVLAQLDGVPLNDEAFGPSGVLADGSLQCNWGDPRADTTGLTTTISRMSRGPALDMLNELAEAEGFTCFTPDGGTRCEKTWDNEQYPVTDGRTLFWRDDLLIDTRYSNLAPSGYTSSIIASLWG